MAYQEYPKVLYRLVLHPDGRSVMTPWTVQSADEERVVRADGWQTTPNDAIAVVEGEHARVVLEHRELEGKIQFTAMVEALIDHLDKRYERKKGR